MKGPSRVTLGALCIPHLGVLLHTGQQCTEQLEFLSFNRLQVTNSRVLSASGHKLEVHLALVLCYPLSTDLYLLPNGGYSGQEEGRPVLRPTRRKPQSPRSNQGSALHECPSLGCEL